ncbi:MAG: hypothetical protein LBF16_05345 [Pseudomonadales bacterium]|nr:hypothetical protein [Pseudomonadales bacterium]
MLLSAALALVGQGAFAQHGHPLQGSWSGNWTSGSQQGRLLVLLDFSVDQVISGSIIEDGVRTPISEASLDPDTWSVTLKGEQQAPDGSSAPLEIKGKIENLGSITERSIVGTWRKGTANGAVRLTIN